MTVPSTTRKAGPYTGNGVQTTFFLDHAPVLTATLELHLGTIAGAELTPSTDYAILSTGDEIDALVRKSIEKSQEYADA